MTPNHVYKYPSDSDTPSSYSPLFLYLGVAVNGDHVFIRYVTDRMIENVSVARFDPFDVSDFGVYDMSDMIDVTDTVKMPEWYKLFVEMTVNGLMKG